MAFSSTAPKSKSKNTSRQLPRGQAIGAYALTEPQSGSDAANMRARAVLSDDGSHYVINGKKSWITSGPVAEYIMLFALTDPEQGARGVSAFLIDTQREGFRCGKTEPKLGIRASATCEIEFENYHCPVEDRLGEEGSGFQDGHGCAGCGSHRYCGAGRGYRAGRLRGFSLTTPGSGRPLAADRRLSR